MIRPSSSWPVLRALAAAAVLMLSCGAVLAFVTGVTVAPAFRTVRLNQPAVVTLTWTVTTDAAADTVTSPPGTFLVAGMPVGTGGAPLAGIPGPPLSISFTETVTIPASIVRRAAEADGIILFTREFVQLGPPVFSATATIRVTGRQTGAPAIPRLVLRFSDDTLSKVLEPGEDVQAIAELELANVDRLRAVWEVSDPLMGGDGALFRPIATVTETLGGRPAAAFRSPQLPRAVSGAYLLRFRVLEPALAGDPPVITYYVPPGAGGEAMPAVPELEIRSPGPQTRLNTRTRFAWTRVAGAALYRLRLYRPADSPDAGARLGGAGPAGRHDLAGVGAAPPVAGVAVPGEAADLTLSAASLARLETGATYVWRLEALAADGSLLAVSAPRRAVALP